MNENQLETFLAVLQYGGYSKAAAALHVTQPTVSYRMQMLEEELGVRLFARAGAKLELSPAGAAFVPEAQALIRSMQETRRRMACFSQKRTLTIGFPEMMLQGECSMFMKIMQIMPEGAEQLASCKTGRPPEDVQQLVRGEVDLIFTDLGQPALDERHFGKHKLFDDVSYVCLRKDHPLANEKELTLSRLQGETIHRYDDLTCFLTRMEAQLAALGMMMEGDGGMTFVQLLPRLVHSGGVIIANQRPVPDPNLVYIPLRLDPPNDVGMAWRKHDCPPALRQLICQVAELPLETWL